MKLKSNKILLTLPVVLLLLFSGYLLNETKPRYAQADTLAMCLRDKEVTMYGAYWCSHCKNQKDLLGDAFRFIPYVECTKDPQKCIENGIRGYPTWIYPGGERLEGEQSLEKLAQTSKCPYSP